MTSSRNSPPCRVTEAGFHGNRSFSMGKVRKVPARLEIDR